MTKICPKCKLEKLLDQFYKRGKYYHSYCKKCHKTNTRNWQNRNPERVRANNRAWGKANRGKTRANNITWRKRNPEKNRENHRKYKYGITSDQYNEMVKNQNNKCAICGIETITPHIDHDHITGRVRGLLCFYCNAGIGYLKEDPIILTNAIKYLNLI